MRSLTIHRESVDSHVASELLASLNAELAHRYPKEGQSYSRLTADDVAPGRGAFVIARSERVPVGCGAIRRVDATTAELKAMYVMPSFRRLGVGRELLKYLESVGRELGAETLILETGVRQPEALTLYRSFQFAETSQVGATIRMEKRPAQFR